MTKRVFVIGVGMTKFEKPGAREGWDYPQMVREAAGDALSDAGLAYADIEHAAVGFVAGESTSGQRALSELSFGFDEPSLFLNLREGSPFYRGPLARLDAHQRLVKAWGGKYPRECLVLPVRVQKRLVAVVYCDRGAEGMSGVDMEQLQEMAAALGHALESFLRKKKAAK